MLDTKSKRELIDIIHKSDAFEKKWAGSWLIKCGISLKLGRDFMGYLSIFGSKK